MICPACQSQTAGTFPCAGNLIVIKAETYGNSDYTVAVPVAGVKITAQNVHGDLLYQLDNRTMGGA